ncbi:MAG: ornithine carbamoyltransferase [Candidatus Latescibacteria bacterium]|nr:ornithine carbamoyltransferase [Candidatus Latescibacterota bacterium]NIM21343.1 ornithine carbamoyltransferase [Candidatus Latescibacterota bacterium]NIM65524.1 ornithine carbamoyltransferase [Candidatus Latescibacterota bacterium]NIO01904.1 ornithine carbamoyltransferase [Candidatus Latescibacterota bacterium]NIO28717.1 ornithine carbamoyltransferase [Candidatus Latescibacterota bacterium]
MPLLRKHFLSLADFTKAELEELLLLAIRQKALCNSGKLERTHVGRTLACIFHKPSLRTRVSFEVAMHQLGGDSIYVTEKEIGIGTREAPQDIARVLARYVSAVMIRTFQQDLVETIAEWSTVPVINGLTDLLHPCQVLADLMTIKEHRGGLEKLTVTFIGDGNNVARSWINACSRFSFKFILACPKGYGVASEFCERALGSATELYEETSNPVEAVKEANVIYTDVWTSMGQEAEARKRLKDFEGFQVNESLLNKAPSDAVVLHCLPAHRGEEITDEVIESKQSLVFDQAENRLHAQRALLFSLIPPGRE